MAQTLGLRDSYCIRSIVPWATPNELNLTVVDFTPNYMCDARAMRRIHEAAPDPSQVRASMLVA